MPFPGENGETALNATKPHFHHRLHKPILKVLPMYRYIVATIYFSGEIFPKQHHVLNTVFKLLQMPKIQIYSAYAIMMANAFKYLPKSEAAVYTCSLKKLL